MATPGLFFYCQTFGFWLRGLYRDRRWLFALCLGALISVHCSGAWAQNEPSDIAPDDYQAWLGVLKEEALAEGISEATFDQALTDVVPLERVLELDKKQPEFTQTFWDYYDKRVTAERIERGQALLKQHAALLGSIERRYGVQARYLVSFWGLESNFGDFTGKIPVIDALVTLAYDPRRADFFRAQLLDALRILDAGHIDLARLKGSWAGAMGHLQFIPSTFVAYAQGRRRRRED